MVLCEGCRVARTTVSSLNELNVVVQELQEDGNIILREGRDKNFMYFVDWVVPVPERVVE